MAGARPLKAITRDIADELICGTCHQDMRQAANWRRGPVFHCSGSNRTWRCTNFNPHHGRRLYSCPKCKKSLGCNICSGKAEEVFCKACKSWGTPEAEIAHGNLNPDKEIVTKLLTSVEQSMGNSKAKAGDEIVNPRAN